jgi:hypothetical protein
VTTKPCTELPPSPIDGLRTIELTAGREPLLQQFFEANPEYFLAVGGEPAGPNEAHEEIHGELPQGWPFTKKWVIGWVDCSGDAHALYRGLEAWAVSNGAAWLRLGVVQGNARAERFWQSLGYVQTRTRGGVQIGRQTNTLRVMFKPFANGTQESYLLLVPRDRPEAP